MRRFRSLPVAALCALALARPIGAEAPSPRAPMPQSETLVYSRQTGSKIDRVEVRTRFVEAGSESYYEVTVESPEETGIYKLAPSTLLALSSDVTTRSEGSTVRRVTTVVETREKPAKGEILVADMGQSMMQSLRALPWGSFDKMKIVFLGAGKARGDFGFDLSVAGKEAIEVAGKKTESWKLQLSMAGFFGKLVGSTKMWYSAEYPHYLVRSESPGMGPGAAPSVLSLTSYSSSTASR